MPTYEYKCPECGDTEEISHSIKIDAEFDCFACANFKEKLVKLIKVPSAGAGVHFKGSGFYETDYRGK